MSQVEQFICGNQTPEYIFRFRFSRPRSSMFEQAFRNIDDVLRKEAKNAWRHRFAAVPFEDKGGSRRCCG